MFKVAYYLVKLIKMFIVNKKFVSKLTCFIYKPVLHKVMEHHHCITKEYNSNN